MAERLLLQNMVSNIEQEQGSFSQGPFLAMLLDQKDGFFVV